MPTNTPRPADVEARARRDVGLDAEVVRERLRRRRRAASRPRPFGSGDAAVVAAGGDGTVGLVAAELLGTSTGARHPAGGTVMNIARRSASRATSAAAATCWPTGVVRKIDVGEAPRIEPFFEAGSVGMNAAIFREAQRFDDGDRMSIAADGLGRPPLPAGPDADRARRRDRPNASADGDGRRTGRTPAPAMTVAPDARLDDGRFDVRVFRASRSGS